MKRYRHLRLVEAPMQTPEEHEQQRSWVEQSCWRSGRSQERRDETACLARLYAHPRARVENVVPLRPEPPRPAA